MLGDLAEGGLLGGSEIGTRVTLLTGSMSTAARRRALLALATGLLSACAFQPLGWWPLMPLAFAVLAWLLAGQRSPLRALLTGWLFAVGQFVLGLNWIATAFTYQAAMPAWLGWVAVTAFIAGSVVLLTQLPRHRPPGAGDGAVL